MKLIGWKVRLSGPSNQDFKRALRDTQRNFESRQVAIYQNILTNARDALREGSFVPGSNAHDGLRPGLPILHVARGGHRGRHMIVYRSVGERTIQALRILHAASDLARHL